MKDAPAPLGRVGLRRRGGERNPRVMGYPEDGPAPPALYPSNSRYTREAANELFTESLRRGVLGSSLSSGPARRRLLRIRLEDLEDGIGDAPLEAPQRLLAGLALRDLLTVVGPAPRVRPGLAYRDHVQ